MDWKIPLRYLKRQVKKIVQTKSQRIANQHYMLNEIARTAHQEGYTYHHREVSNDPVLLEWVLRKDYWDAPISVD